LEYHVFIPARGGSKRFPGKNLHYLGDIPLISHSIIYALQTFSPDRIWVNSDDDTILDEGKKLGVQTVKRPQELAGDLTPTAEVSEFQVRELEKLGIPCDALILLQPTNPLRPENLLRNSIEVFDNCERESLATFSLLNKKIGVVRNDCFYPTNYTPGQRMQDKSLEYFENGSIYITRVEAIKRKVIITEDVYPLIVEDVSCHLDIDEPDDMLYAEFLLKKKSLDFIQSLNKN